MAEKKISISGLDKAEVLAALYNAARPQGMGFLHYDPNPMTVEEAQKHLKAGDDLRMKFGEVMRQNSLYFDYLKGRVMKVDLSGDGFDPCGYDCDNGQGAAGRVIAQLRKTGNVNPSTSQLTHHMNTEDAFEEFKKHLS